MLPTRSVTQSTTRGGGGSRAQARLAHRDSRGSSKGSRYDDTYRKHASLSVYLRRVVHYAQMDSGVASAEAYFLLTCQLGRLFRLAGWRSQTCGRWSKSDPAFACLLCALISTSTTAIALTVGRANITTLVANLILHVSLFLISGILIASALWALTNSGAFLVKHHFSSTVEVEWLYSFDVHTYAYFAMWLLLYVLQFLLLPLLLSDSLLSSFLSNSLYATAFGVYTFVTFRGYLELPFLAKSQVTALLYPILAWAILFVMMTTLNVNATKLSIRTLF
mmetsp:Transcript_18148/g.33537  ORF Transcript_18148/g.33537 Transcript_18148/m.33537 type:complete len:278 (+) Transcript_18148:143-976(+)